MERVSEFVQFERIALRKLKGKRAGQYSIRINDQYRICFVWTERGPINVEICDYH